VKQADTLVFDERLADTSLRGGRYRIMTYTSLAHSELFRGAGRIAIQAMVHLFGSGSDLPVTVTLEHSADGRTFRPKGRQAELDGVIARGTVTSTLVGGEPSPVRPSHQFVRLRIEVGDGIHPFDLRLLLHITARGAPFAEARPRSSVAAVPEGERPPPLGVARETVREVHGLLRASAHLAPADRQRHVLDRLSEGGRADVARALFRLRALSEAEKHVLAGFAGGLLALAALPSERRERS